MKYKHYLNEILAQKSKLSALRYLITKQDSVSVRELSRRIHVTQPNLSTILKELEQANVLVSKKIGTSLVFSLNQGHYLVEDVLAPLFRAENNSLTLLGDFLKKEIRSKYLSLILFGSIARGDSHHKSDIDLAVIIDNKANGIKVENGILALNPKIIKKFGNMLSPIVISQKDFSLRYKKGDKLILNITREGKIVGGKLISELL